MAFELGFTEEQYTEQDKIDKGIWYPIPTGIEDGRTVSIKITIPEYNGAVELSEEVAEYLGKTDDGKIKDEVRQKIPLFRISSTDNKQYKRKGFVQMDKEQKKRSGGQPSIEKLVEATEEANAEALIRDWKNLIDSKTGKEIPFSMPMAARIMKSHPSISDRILEIAQDKNNYLVGAPSTNIEALAEK